MRSHPLILPALILLALGLPPATPAQQRSYGTGANMGGALAVRVEDVPLAHTTQLLPVDAQGRLAHPGSAGGQAGVLLDRLAALLGESGSGLGKVVKLNVYLARQEHAADVEKVLAARFRGQARPAISSVVTPLPHPGALVALDAVAVSTRDGAGVRRLRAKDVPGTEAHVAIQPPGTRVHVSGQAERGETLAEATRLTLASLEKTLRFLGLQRGSVVQVKAFLNPMAEADVVRKELAAFFGGEAPPAVLVEWTFPLIEIELIASGGKARARPVVEYLTPPDMKASPVFSRVARVARGGSIYVAGLHGPAKATPAEEIEGIFAQLERALEDAGGDLRHLVKATYYVTSDEARRKLGELRPRYYDPRRPPAASLAPVAGVGRPDRSLTLDMIAVPSPARALNEYGPAEVGAGLTPEEAAAGWLSLFDGQTAFGWRDAAVTNGQLKGGTTTSTFGRGELRAEVARAGRLVVAGREMALPAGTFRLADTGRAGAIRCGEGLVLTRLLYRPLGLEPLWNGMDLTGWKRIDAPSLPDGRRALWQVEEGRLHVKGGPGALEYQGGRFGDLAVQIGVRTRARYSNGGLFLRCIPGDRMNGYEAQLHNRCEGRDPARPARYSTGGIDDRQNARRLVSRDGEPFVMTVLAAGPHLAAWVNGYQVADWTDDRPASPNPRQGLRLEPGTLQLQAHDPDTDYDVLFLRAAPVK